MLPWKDYHKTLPDNFDLSRQKLTGLIHCLLQNPAMLEHHDRIIKHQIQQGIVDPASNTGNLRHYLLHHAVHDDPR